MSLDGAYDPENVFAKILRGELPCHKVYEDDAVLAFMDIFPQSPGHTLVIPKTEARNLFEAQDDALATLIARVKKVAAGVREAMNADGVAVVQRNGAAASQTVFHLHFNIVPYTEGGRTAPHAQGAKGDDAVLAEQAKKIAAAIEG
ncbi:MAG: HIT family protein [Maricaulaceae bacterium]